MQDSYFKQIMYMYSCFQVHNINISLEYKKCLLEEIG